MHKTLLNALKFCLLTIGLISLLGIESCDTGNSKNSIKKPYVLLISIDGYRHDYTKTYKPRNISFIAENGVQAESLKPIYPSMTFPNHYTIVTGRYAENHGIVSNSFYDPKTKKTYSLGDGKSVRDGSWYGGEPLWVAAENNKMVSASMFWVGSEAQIMGRRPTYWVPYSSKVPSRDRVKQVIDWLKLPESKRPHFLTLYFSSVDSAGHSYGTDSKQVRDAIYDVDNAMGYLLDELKDFPFDVNIVLVSDHGMSNNSKNRLIFLSDYFNYKDYKMSRSGASAMIYSDDEASLKKIQKSINSDGLAKAYLKKEIPSKFNYQNSRVIGDLLIVPNDGYYIKTTRPGGSLGAATHGWDPAFKDMHGIFYAYGEAFHSNMKISTFENVHIYPLILEVLDIKTKKSHDGDISVLRSILAPTADKEKLVSGF